MTEYRAIPMAFRGTPNQPSLSLDNHLFNIDSSHLRNSVIQNSQSIQTSGTTAPYPAAIRQPLISGHVINNYAPPLYASRVNLCRELEAFIINSQEMQLQLLWDILSTRKRAFIQDKLLLQSYQNYFDSMNSQSETVRMTFCIEKTSFINRITEQIKTAFDEIRNAAKSNPSRVDYIYAV